METFNKDVQTLLEMAYGLGPGNTKITKQQLIDIIGELDKKGATPFSVTQITKQASRKAPFPKFTLPGLKHGDTYFGKVTQVNGILNFDYEGNVNTQRAKENLPTDFKSEQGWSNAITRAIHELDGQLYLYYRPNFNRPDYTPVYVVSKNNEGTEFEVIPQSKVNEYKTATPDSQKQGVEEKIIVRKISVDSIAAIKINGIEYAVEDLDPVRSAIFDAVQPKG